MNIDIRPLSEELLEDFLEFFDRDAFSDNPEWEGCYCCFYHIGNDAEWMESTAESNRNTSIDLIKRGEMRGYLAYCDGRPIGWCNVNDKLSFPRLMRNGEISGDDDKNTASVVCFVVSCAYRRKGIASLLLDRLCREYSQKGYEYLEAYPVKGEQTSARHYHGPFEMYERAGFEIFRELEKAYVVRKSLNAVK